MTRPLFTSADDLEAFLRGLESSPSDEAGLTELEHLLQCAEVLRATAPDDGELQIAGLLHDIGFGMGPERDHGRLGADAVRGLVGERVAELVRLHVDAKRYLVTRNADYRAKLSPVSLATLALQGADMPHAEIEAFEASPHHQDAIRLREADDLAKIPGRPTAALDFWMPTLRSVIAARDARV